MSVLFREKEELAEKEAAAVKKKEASAAVLSTASSGYGSKQPSPADSPPPQPELHGEASWDSYNTINGTSTAESLVTGNPTPPPVTRILDLNNRTPHRADTNPMGDLSEGMKRMVNMSAPVVGRGAKLMQAERNHSSNLSPPVVGRGAKLKALLDQNTESERVVGHAAPAPILPLGRTQRIQMLYGNKT